MITNIRHMGIVVDNLDDALSFYVDLLGFKVKNRNEESGPFIVAILGFQEASVTTVKLEAPDGNLIELLRYKSPVGKRVQRNINDLGLSHIALTVGDLDSVCESLMEAGGQFISPPMVNPEKTAKVVFCRDPQGNILELVQIL